MKFVSEIALLGRTHAKQGAIQTILRNIAQFLSSLKAAAQQLINQERIHVILQRAFAKYRLKPPKLSM
jgi:hypothetical protein